MNGLIAMTETLRDELQAGPDARQPIPNACPQCESDVDWCRILEWSTYPDCNWFEVYCDNPDCNFYGKINPYEGISS